jgi:hypothetical protein
MKVKTGHTPLIVNTLPDRNFSTVANLINFWYQNKVQKKSPLTLEEERGPIL